MSSKGSIRGLDPEGVPDGDYVVTVSGGNVVGLTEASAGGGSAGGLPVIDVVADHGAAVDGVTDDTAAWQDAINAAAAAGGGRIISSRVGASLISGALQDTGGANAQILLPAIDYVDSEQISIVIEGAVPPPTVFSVVGATPIPDNHLVLKSTLNAGAGGAVIGGRGPAGTLVGFTNLLVQLKNLTVRLPANPVLTGLNLSKVACVDLDHVVVDAGNYYVGGLTQPTTTTSFGIRVPAVGNGAHTRLGAVAVCGFYTGFQFAEHTVGQQVNAWGCAKAFDFGAADHASKFQRMMSVHCPRVVTFSGAHYVDIDQLDIEHTAVADGGWTQPLYDLDDASNYGHGAITWHTVLGNVGVVGDFFINGAANMHTMRVGSTATAGITVQDENGTIATGVTQLDFVGANVAATTGTGEVIVTVTGSTSTTTGELLMQDGVTAPPVPLENEARSDWLYQG